MEKDQPYDWQSSLINAEFRGIDEFADITLKFEDNIAKVYVNGREFYSSGYNADYYEYQDRKIETEDLYLRNGKICDLAFREIKANQFILAEFTGLDGSTRSLIFYSRSPESILKIPSE